MKQLKFIGNVLDDIKLFPTKARRAAGFQLHKIQQGLEPSDWKPMNGLGIGVKEIRIQVDGQFRVIYVSKFKEAVYVLHAFKKKTQKTSTKDLDKIKQRMNQIRGA